MNPPPKERSTKLRSRDWFGKDDRWGLVHRAWLRAEGFSERVFEGKPVIGSGGSPQRGKTGAQFPGRQGLQFQFMSECVETVINM
jgi:hypothetical protein